MTITSDETSDLDILNVDHLTWSAVPIKESGKTVFLKKSIEAMIENEELNSYPMEKSRTLPGRNYGYLHSNLKGLLSVSNGNNVMVLNVED